MHKSTQKATFLLVALLLVGCAGCAGRPSLIPNADKSLRRTSAQFAADAAKRHPYKSDAPRGGEAVGRAQIGVPPGEADVAITIGCIDHQAL